MANISNINNILRVSSSGVGLNKNNTGPSELDIESAGADMIDMTRTGLKTYRFAISGSSNFSIFDVAANDDRLTISSGGDATFSGGVTAPLLTIDNTVINSNTISNASASMILDSAGDIILDADGADIILKDAGTEFGRLTNDSSNLEIKSSINDKDIIFKGVDNSSEITALTLDMSEGGNATFAGGVTVSGTITANSDLDQILNLNSSDSNAVYLAYQRGGVRKAYVGYGGSGNTFNIVNEISDGNISITGNDGGVSTEVLSFNVAAGGVATFESSVIAPNVFTQNIYITSSGTNSTNRIDNDGTQLYLTYGGTSSRALEILNSNGNATFAGDITLDDDLNFSTNGFADISNTGTGAMRFKPSGQTLALTLTGANATFAGSVTATTFSGDLNGTINTVTTATTKGNSTNDTTVATTAFVQNVIGTIPAGLVFQGTWNASTNTPTLSSGSGTTGHFYIVSVAGSTNLDGITDWEVGDWAVFIEQGASDQWEKIDNSSVLSGSGTGGSFAGWSGSGTSVTLGNAPVTFSGNNSTFAGTIDSGTITSTGIVKAATTFQSTSGSMLFFVPNVGQALEIAQNTGNATFAGDVSLSTANADTILTIANTASGGSTWKVHSASSSSPSAVSSGDFLIRNGSTNVLRLGTNTNATFAGAVNVKTDKVQIDQDGTYGGSYATVGFGGKANGSNRIFGATGTGDGLFLASATGRGIFFRVGGGAFDNVSFNADGTATFAGDVVIGTSTTTPSTHYNNLVIEDVAGNNVGISLISGTGNNTALYFGDSADTDVGQLKYSHATNDMFFVTNAATAMTIDENQNVGIGYTSPASILHVGSTGTNAYSTTITKGSNMKGIINTLSNNADDMVGIYFATGTTTEGTHWSGITGSRTDNASHWGTQLNFYTHANDVAALNDATQKMVIKGDGKVGIGTTSPGRKLTVTGDASGDANNLLLANENDTDGDSASIGFSMLSNNTYVKSGIFFKRTTTQGRGDLIFANNNEVNGNNVTLSDAKITIQPAGNVGIGTTSPTDYGASANTLEVRGASGSGGGVIRVSNAGNTAGARFYAGSVNSTIGTENNQTFNIATNNTQRLVILGGGNVGIGTTSPTTLLNTLVTANSENMTLGSAANMGFKVGNTTGNEYGICMGVGDSGRGWIQVGRTDGTAIAYDLTLQTSGGNVGIGNTSPNATLEIGTPSGVAGSAGSVNRLFIAPFSNTGGPYKFIARTVSGASDFLDMYYGSNHIISYGLDGKVGIGATSPTAKLEIVTAVGADAIRMNYGQSADIFLGFQSANPRIILQDNSNVITHNFVSNGDNYIVGSNVGIGTTSPSGALHVYSGTSERFLITGDVHVQGSTDLNINGTSRRLSFTAGTGTIRTTTANNLIFQTNSTTRFTVANSGTVTATGDVVAYSDKRLKTNIETLDGSKVYKMRGVSFIKDEIEGSGVIAQELEKIAPELINNDSKYKAVAYGNLTGYLIEAVKELKAEIEELKKHSCDCKK